MYGNIPLYEAELEEITDINLQNTAHSDPPASLPARFEGSFEGWAQDRVNSYKPDDAWSTIMQWLYHRMGQIHAEYS